MKRMASAIRGNSISPSQACGGQEGTSTARWCRWVNQEGQVRVPGRLCDQVLSPWTCPRAGAQGPRL